MVKPKQIGARRENQVLKELERQGFRKLFKSYTIKMGYKFVGLDFADLFDLVVAKGKEWKFISVKSRNEKKHREAIKNFILQHKPEKISFEYWVHNKYKRGSKKYKIIDFKEV